MNNFPLLFIVIFFFYHIHAHIFMVVRVSFCKKQITKIHHLQVHVDNLHYLTRILYRDPGDGVYGEHEVDYILFLQKDLEIKPNPGEVNEILWLKRENLDDQIASLKYPLTPWFKLIYESGLLKIWWNNLSQLETIKNSNIHKMS